VVYPATLLVLSVLAIILILFWLGYYWARTHGQFDDVEEAKYRMLENERSYHDEDYSNSVRHS
jgi:cbb3-type cytochrome oxidase maturation protein